MNLIEQLIQESTNLNKKSSKKLKEGLSREELIDKISDFYNDYNYDYNNSGFVEDALDKVSGKDHNSLSDQDPDEGFYANYTTDELQKVFDLIEKEIFSRFSRDLSEFKEEFTELLYNYPDVLDRVSDKEFLEIISDARNR